MTHRSNPGTCTAFSVSAETELSQDALASQQFGAEADHKTQHGQAAIPGFGEIHESEAGLSVFSHRYLRRESQWSNAEPAIQKAEPAVHTGSVSGPFRHRRGQDKAPSWLLASNC